jgi:hypothetical protein
MPRPFTAAPATQPTLDVRQDDSDARDLIFEPRPVLLPDTKGLDMLPSVPVLHQGNDGGCVGFALATVLNISIRRRFTESKAVPDPTWASPGMLYEMARHYDEWAGESYQGTSLRGALKGWHKHGVASDGLWDTFVTAMTTAKSNDDEAQAHLNQVAANLEQDARSRPLGAYYRIVDNDVSHMQAAIVEGDVVLAAAWIHDGWKDDALVQAAGRSSPPTIPVRSGHAGLHAFAIVGYTPHGFIVQNSWGPKWGKTGKALLTYDDWMENRQDAWVARPGPATRNARGDFKVFLDGFVGGAATSWNRISSSSSLAIDAAALPFLINTGSQGGLSADGGLRTLPNELPAMALQALGTPILETMTDSTTRHLILFAHGGRCDETSSTLNAGKLWRYCHDNGIGNYCFVWETGDFEALWGLMQGENRQGPAGLSLADMLHQVQIGVANGIKAAKSQIRQTQKDIGASLAWIVRDAWDVMKNRAEAATSAGGGAHQFIEELIKSLQRTPADTYKIHLVGHSAGCIFLSQLYHEILHGKLGTGNVHLGSVQFLAPAITLDQTYKLLFDGKTCLIPKERFVIYTLSPDAEEHDNIGIYPSSLLTYIADHLEHAKPGVRVPVLGIYDDLQAANFQQFAQINAGVSSVKHGGFATPYENPPREIGHVIEAIKAGRF